MIVAVGNQKGGVGKTTVACNVAAAFHHGALAPTVLVDADPQGSAVQWGASGLLGPSVLPLPLEEGTEPSAWVRAVLALAADARAVVVDLPPQRGAAMAAAVSVCDLLLVPVTPSGADLRATLSTLELVRDARQRLGSDRPRVLLVPSRVDRRTAAGREVEAVLHEFGEIVGPMVGQRSAFVDAFAAQGWIGATHPRTAGHREIEALAAVVRRIAAKAEKERT